MAGLTLGGVDRLALYGGAATWRKPCAIGADADIPGRNVGGRDRFSEPDIGESHRGPGLDPRARRPITVFHAADSDDFGQSFRAEVGHLFRLMPAGHSD